MGVSTSPQQFAGKLEHLAKAMASNVGPVTETTLFVRTVIQGAFAAGGVKESTAPIRSKMLSNDAGLVYGAGKAALIDKGVDHPFVITPRGGVGRVRSVKLASQGFTNVTGHALGGGVIPLAGHPVAFVNHPPTRGKHLWPIGAARAEAEAPAVLMKAQVSTPLKVIFG